jgi:hypothetical protein
MPHTLSWFFRFALYFVNCKFCKLYMPVLVNKALYFCLGRRLRSDGGASTERGKYCGVQQQKSLYPTWGTTFKPVGTLYHTVPKVAPPLVIKVKNVWYSSVLFERIWNKRVRISSVCSLYSLCRLNHERNVWYKNRLTSCTDIMRTSIRVWQARIEPVRYLSSSRHNATAPTKHTAGLQWVV